MSQLSILGHDGNGNRPVPTQSCLRRAAINRVPQAASRRAKGGAWGTRTRPASHQRDSAPGFSFHAPV